MNKKTSLKDSFIYAFGQLSRKEQIIWILQCVLFVAIVAFAVMGLQNIFPIYTTNVIDLVLLILLFLICGIKLIPQRLVYAIIYFVLAVLMGAILIASFII